MDETDLAILRELARDQVGGWGRLDPRISASEIARHVDIARSTVSTRLERWDESGFLVGYKLAPNTGLFDAVHQAGSVRVDDPRRKPSVVESLSMMDAVAGLLDHVGTWVGFALVSQDKGGLDRAARLIGGIEGVDGVETGPAFQPPCCDATLSPLDWRILAAVREDPLGPDHEAADRAGVSARTFRRRYRRMVRQDAVMLMLELDFTAWTGGALSRFVVHLDAQASRSAAAKRVQATLPASMFINNSLRPDAEQPWPVLDAVAHLPSVAEAAGLERALLSLAGVEDVEVLFPCTLATVTHWVDARIDQELDGD